MTIRLSVLSKHNRIRLEQRSIISTLV